MGYAAAHIKEEETNDELVATSSQRSGTESFIANGVGLRRFLRRGMDDVESWPVEQAKVPCETTLGHKRAT